MFELLLQPRLQQAVVIGCSIFLMCRVSQGRMVVVGVLWEEKHTYLRALVVLLAWRGLQVCMFFVLLVSFLVAGGGILKADAKTLGAGARLLGADANFLFADLIFLRSGGNLLVAVAKSLKADEISQKAEGSFPCADENSLRDYADLLKSAVGLLFLGSFKFKSAYLFVLGACCSEY